MHRGRFVRPAVGPRDRMERAVMITAAKLGYLLEGIDWRLPQHTWRHRAQRSSSLCTKRPPDPEADTGARVGGGDIEAEARADGVCSHEPGTAADDTALAVSTFDPS